MNVQQYERVEDAGRALALGIVADAMKDREGRRWLRLHPLAKAWCRLADLDWSAVVRQADAKDAALTGWAA